MRPLSKQELASASSGALREARNYRKVVASSEREGVALLPEHIKVLEEAVSGQKKN